MFLVQYSVKHRESTQQNIGLHHFCSNDKSSDFSVYNIDRTMIPSESENLK